MHTHAHTHRNTITDFHAKVFVGFSDYEQTNFLARLLRVHKGEHPTRLAKVSQFGLRKICKFILLASSSRRLVDLMACLGLFAFAFAFALAFAFTCRMAVNFAGVV